MKENSAECIDEGIIISAENFNFVGDKIFQRNSRKAGITAE